MKYIPQAPAGSSVTGAVLLILLPAFLLALLAAPARGVTGQEGPATADDRPVESQVLRGRVLGADGLPSPGLRIRAQHAAGGKTKGFALRTRGREQELTQLGPGEPEVSTQTNRLGEFTFEGLAEGSYFIWTKSSAYEHWSVYSEPLTKEPVPTGENPVDLVHDQASLLVELANPDGSAWLGSTDSTAIDYERRHFPAWGSRVRVRLSPAMAVGDSWAVIHGANPDYVHGVPTGDGAIRFDVTPGVDYLLGAVGMDEKRVGFDGRSQHVVARPDASSTLVTLRSGPLPQFGALVLSATVRSRQAMAWPNDVLPRDAEGGQQEGPSPYYAGYSSYIEIEEADSGLVVLTADENQSSPFRFGLPPGAYRAVARAETDRARMVGVDHGGASSRFVVEANATTRVHLDVGEGGALRIAVADTGKAGVDGDICLKRVMPSGRSAAVYWRRPMGYSQSVAQHSQWFPGGETKITEPLPAGTYRIVGHRGWQKSGGKRYDIPVTIKDGEIVDLRLD